MMDKGLKGFQENMSTEYKSYDSDASSFVLVN